jgi:hypothetical protein
LLNLVLGWFCHPLSDWTRHGCGFFDDRKLEKPVLVRQLCVRSLGRDDLRNIVGEHILMRAPHHFSEFKPSLKVKTSDSIALRWARPVGKAGSSIAVAR